MTVYKIYWQCLDTSLEGIENLSKEKKEKERRKMNSFSNRFISKLSKKVA